MACPSASCRSAKARNTVRTGCRPPRNNSSNSRCSDLDNRTGTFLPSPMSQPYAGIGPPESIYMYYYSRGHSTSELTLSALLPRDWFPFTSCNSPRTRSYVLAMKSLPDGALDTTSSHNRRVARFVRRVLHASRPP